MSSSWFGRWVPPLKETEDRPDFSLLDKRITELIAGDPDMEQHADELKAEVAKLSSMRAACIMPRQLDEAALEKLKEYSRILRMVHKRVSSSNIMFKWRCSITQRGGGVFTSDPSICKGGLGLELRAVSYQMGVCCAAIAARLSEGDELKTAPKWFKNAYFLFIHARDGIEVDLHKECTLNRDLKPDVLLAISRVMLAQAANVFQRVMSAHAIDKYEGKHEREKMVRVQSLLLLPVASWSLVTLVQLFQFAVVANATYRVAREKMHPLLADYPAGTLECIVLEQ